MLKLNKSQIAIGTCLLALATTAAAKDIVHDSEHYILQAQHGIQWAKEDEDIQKKLAALKEKHGSLFCQLSKSSFACAHEIEPNKTIVANNALLNTRLDFLFPLIMPPSKTL